MSYKTTAPVIRSIVTNIDATTTGQTTLLTVPAGKNFIATNVGVTTTSVSGFISDPTCSIGSNNPTYDDVINFGSLGLPLAGDLFTDIASPSVVLPATTVVVFNISVAAVATTQVFTVILQGYYI